MDTLAKLYDTFIMNRLKLWMDVDNCQAGAMKGRGCLEHIFTLRLLCDYVKYKELKLYILFIDYRKAYNKVPRSKLIECLKSIGCGRRMLKQSMLCIGAHVTCLRVPLWNHQWE